MKAVVTLKELQRALYLLCEARKLSTAEAIEITELCSNELDEIESTINKLNTDNINLAWDSLVKESKVLDLEAEIDRLKPLASKQVPMKVKVERYCPTLCPSCSDELSEHVNDGYYVINNRVKFCGECGQRLGWESNGCYL